MVFVGAIGDARYELVLPWLGWALALAAASVGGSILALARRPVVERVVAASGAATASLLLGSWTFGTPHHESLGKVFAVAFGWLGLALGLAAAGGAAALVLLGSAVRAHSVRSGLAAAAILLVAAGSAALMLPFRIAFRPGESLPVLAPVGEWDGHIGLAQRVEARLVYRREVNRPFERFRGEQWECSQCAFDVEPKSPGILQFVARASCGPLSMEQALSFRAIEERGSTLMDLSEGNRWTYRRRSQGGTAPGGWLVAAGTRSLDNLVPRSLPTGMGVQTLTLRVGGTVVHDRRRWRQLVLEGVGEPKQVEVSLEDGESWVVVRRKRRPLLQRAGPTVGGLLRCSSPVLPFTTCTDGTVPGFPLVGPSGGGRKSDIGGGLLGLFLGVVTAGAVAGGGGGAQDWCLESVEAGEQLGPVSGGVLAWDREWLCPLPP